MRLTFWVGFWVFLADQATKWFVVHWLDLATRHEIAVLPPYVTFRMAWNTGVNFGILSGLDMRWVLIAFAVVISGLVLFWVGRDRGGRMASASAGLLVGGALGNVVDRVLYGAVADFLNTSLPSWQNPYSFNIADIAVFLGAAGLVVFGGEPGAGKARGVDGKGA
ncbi:MAG: signal peptidase II [Rubellimicrobium sp.]|nr:signal peptidase II [Rubellimicrobium sp.]